MDLGFLVLSDVVFVVTGTYGNGIVLEGFSGDLEFLVFSDESEANFTVLLVTLVECQ